MASKSHTSASTAELSDGSSANHLQLDDESLNRCVAAILAAVELYQKLNAEALAKKECFDGLVKIDLPEMLKADGLPVVPQCSTEEPQCTEGPSIDIHAEELPSTEGPSIDIRTLGSAFAKAKGTLKKLDVGKIKVVALKGEVFVRSVASGFQHGEAVGAVFKRIGLAVDDYSETPRTYVAVSTDALYYGNPPFWTAPDVTVKSVGLPGGGNSTNLAHGPIFFAEVEHNNRTRIELIRHIGMLFANYPNLNGVLGIKAGIDPDNGLRHLVLMVIVVETPVGGQRQRRVTELVDFGTDELPLRQRNNVAEALRLLLPPANTAAVAGTHGAGVAPHLNLPQWQRYRNGYEDPGQTIPHTIEIDLHLLTDGSFSLTGQPLVLPGPPNRPAVLSLSTIAEKFLFY